MKISNKRTFNVKAYYHFMVAMGLSFFFVIIRSFIDCFDGRIHHYRKVEYEEKAQRVARNQERVTAIEKKFKETGFKRCIYGDVTYMLPSLIKKHQTCCICLNDYLDSDEITLNFCAPGGHSFHYKCF